MKDYRFSTVFLLASLVRCANNRDMSQRALAPALVIAMSAAVATPYAQPPATASQPSLVGAWTLNKDLSDKPQDRSGGESRDDGQNGRRGGGGGGGGRRRGGGGFGGGGFGGGGAAGGNQEDAQRLRNALRDEMEAPDHLIITQSATTVIMTTADGRTIRLSTDGKKIKDESTKVERKTAWAGGKLVSEIEGLGRSKITETYTVDTEKHQLHVSLAIDGPQRKTTVNRVYDADPR
jgi:hypothetical protein